jgi:protein-tyrosine kinase
MDMQRPLIMPELEYGARHTIGAILVEAGRLTPDATARILNAQKEDGTRFGDVAQKLGLLAPHDIQYALSRQFDYACLHHDDLSISREVVAAYRPNAPVVEQLRALRARLMMRWLGNKRGGRTIAVTSAARHEGRSFIAANLAVVFSQLGERTLLIDADLRNPSQHKLFKLESRVGLSAVLAGHAGSEAITRIPGLANLSVLPAGHVPPNPQELLGRPMFAQQLTRAADLSDVIIIDTAASSMGADAEMVAAFARSALIVARNNTTPAGELETLNMSLVSAGTEVLGAVLNDF